MRISLAIREPYGNGEGTSGGFEWRTDPTEGEQAFRSLRMRTAYTRFWHDVEVPEEVAAKGLYEVEEWLDSIYWDMSFPQQESILGAPARAHGSRAKCENCGCSTPEEG